MGELTPVTADQLYLAKMAGMDVEIPQPVTVDQMFMQKIIENGGSGGASSWNDLKDRPFYSETETITVLENYPVTEEGNDGSHGGIVAMEKLFSSGDKLIITAYGKQYEAVASVNESSLLTAVVIENGEYVLTLGCFENPDATVVGLYKGASTISVAVVRETVHKLDAKYLPAGVGDLILSVESHGEELSWVDSFTHDEIYTAAMNGKLVCHVYYCNSLETGEFDSVAVINPTGIVLDNHPDGRSVQFAWDLFLFGWTEDGFWFEYD